MALQLSAEYDKQAKLQQQQQPNTTVTTQSNSQQQQQQQPIATLTHSNSATRPLSHSALTASSDPSMKRSKEFLDQLRLSEVDLFDEEDEFDDGDGDGDDNDDNDDDDNEDNNNDNDDDANDDDEPVALVDESATMAAGFYLFHFIFIE